MAIGKREYRQAVRRCQEMRVTMDMLPIPNYSERTSDSLDPWEWGGASQQEEYLPPCEKISVKLFDKLSNLAA